jgi:hypothetical protein
VESLLSKWEAEIDSRRKRTPHDPLADVIESCRAELQLVVERDRKLELTTEEYGTKHRRQERTVRRWCQQGKIKCRPVGRGYLIPVDEPPPAFVSHPVDNVA